MVPRQAELHTPAYLAVALKVPWAVYLCTIDAVPFKLVVTVLSGEPSPKLMVMTCSLMGAASCRRRRLVGCPLGAADVSVTVNMNDCAAASMLDDVRVMLVATRCTAIHVILDCWQSWSLSKLPEI